MSQPPPPVVILCGGQARRMGGVDKGALNLNGVRLIDHVLARLSDQTANILINGPHDYGLARPLVADDPSFEGPVAGLFGAADHLGTLSEPPIGFVTVPADGPNLPEDLVQRLAEIPNQAAIATDENGLHPTFAYWPLTDLRRAKSTLKPNAALRALAKAVGARQEHWPSDQAFLNINTPEDLAKYQATKP